MIIPLRDYQAEQNLAVRRILSKHRRVVVQGATGSGKTHQIADIILRASEKGMVSIVLVDGEEILNQIANKCIANNIEFQILISSNKYIIPGYKVYICMAETFYRRLSTGWFNNIDIKVQINDECHMGLYNKIIDSLDEQHPNRYLIGYTATPIASSLNDPLNKRYNTIIPGKSVDWLINNSYLVPAIEMGYNELLEFKKLAGEFSQESQMQVFHDKNIDKTIFDMWEARSSDRQTIDYCINISHANEVFELYKKHNISARIITSKTPIEERIANLKAYQNGLCQVLVNVNCFTKGYDSPQTRAIIERFATMSLPKHLQVIGRGGRPCPEIGKIDFHLIDAGNNHWRHGKFRDEIDWKSIFEDETRLKGFKVKKNINLCPICYTFYDNPHLPKCTTCGNDFKIKPMMAMLDAMPESLKKPLAAMTLSELMKYAKYKGYNRGWAWNQHLARGLHKQQTFSWNKKI